MMVNIQKDTQMYGVMEADVLYFPNRKSYGEEMDFRHATESEKQVIFDALAKIGKMWDAEKLEITNLKYVPKVELIFLYFNKQRFYYNCHNPFN